MPYVSDVLRIKGAGVYSVPMTATVLEATQEMNQNRVGAVVVMDGDRVAGIFTERDVLRRVVARERQPALVKVSEVMTEEVICCGLETDLDEVSFIMKEKRIRHLPVCDGNGCVLGMVSIGDVNAMHASHQEMTIHFLSEYIYGRV